MKKIILGAMVLSGILFGADYSKSSNEDLINLSGKVEPKDISSYFKEIEKRVDEMSMKEAREFRDKLREQEMKVYDNMKVKDFKARQNAIREAMKTECKGKKGECGMPKMMGKGGKDMGRGMGECPMMPPPAK